MLKNSTVLAHLLQSYARSGKLQRGKQVHARLITSGGATSTFVANHLLTLYAKCGDLSHAVSLFDTMPHRNLVTWTAMISGLSQNRRFSQSLHTFSLMLGNGIVPTEFAFSSAIQASAAVGLLAAGRQLHSLTVKCGLDHELFVGSNLADMYSKCGSLADARRMFDDLPEKDEVSWTAMIDGYAKNGDSEEALVAFGKMIGGGGCVAVDQHVLCTVLGVCSDLKAWRLGRSLHSCIIKLDFGLEEFIRNAVLDMYSKAGDMDSALCVAGKESSSWNVVSCSSLIDGYVELDQMEKALGIYVESQRQGIEPNEFTFSCMIKACASNAALEQGAQLHAQVIKTRFIQDPFVSSVLVDMYGKCGLLDSSVQVFEEMQHPTGVAWNSIIGSLAQHGRGREAARAFDQMVSSGTKPNSITFISLLKACSHSGLVGEGLEFFDSMKRIYSIEPTEEHFSCVIDLLGRAGRLREAEEFISRMPFEPNAYGWCSLLGACKTHGDKELGEVAAEKLMKLEPENSGIHVLLSSIYSTAGQWEDVKSVRKLMRDSKIKKLPGLSWVDVNNKTHVFGAENSSHQQMKEIYEKLEDLSVRIREAGYIPFTGAVTSNLDDSSKARILHHHSERIAVAFALMSMPSTKPIIVKKNLRVCVDCHSAIKLISKVERREIIIRDSARFHHFADGLCSCGDYW